MATITFHTNDFGAAATDDPTLIEHTEGSGLGFFGGAFGISVPVGEYQDATFVCNSNGTASGVKASNTKFLADFVEENSGVSWNGSDYGTSGIPNYAAPLNIRFTHEEGVRVQNCRLRVFDRNDIENHASGVTTQIFEVRHPHALAGHDANKGPLAHRAKTTHEWSTYRAGTAMSDLAVTSGPGPSGLNTVTGDPLPELDGIYRNWISQSGDACRATRHDWYLAISASPDTIGSKTDYGLYFTLEYL